MTPQNKPDITTLNVKVGVLETDMREVKDGLLGLDTKIDRGLAELARENRASFAALSNQLSERQRTPWATLISGAGFIVLVLGIFGKQAITPLSDGLTTLSLEFKRLDEKSVPRAEIDQRRAGFERTLELIIADGKGRDQVMSGRIDKIEDRLNAEKDRRIEALEKELRNIRREK